MKNERNVPILCLKLGVDSCLFNNEKKKLCHAPYKADGKTMIPTEALLLLGIESEGDFLPLESVKGFYKNENEMGLIFISDCECDVDLTVERDLTYMLSLANAFIFDIPRVKMSLSYAPATKEEIRGFNEVGNYVTDLLLARKNERPYVLGSKKIFDTLREIYNSKDGSYEYDCILKLLNIANNNKRHFPELKDDGSGFKTPFAKSGYGEDEYDVGGRHTNSETYAMHLRTFAFAYQITGDETYSRMAYFGALGIIERKHWGPGHFLNCSGAAGYLAVAYDWLVDSWKALGLDTRVVKKGIYTHGIHHGYNSVIYDNCDFPSPKQGTGWRFKCKPDNWNSVCNSGLVIASLCLLGDGPDEVITPELYEKVKIMIGASLSSITQDGLIYKQYAPDGSYVESNSYWDYGTSHLVRTMGALHSALGTDLGLHNGCGIDKTCYYALNSESADYVGWNYHDGHLSKQGSALFSVLATVNGDTMLYSLRQEHVRRGKGIEVEDMVFGARVKGITPPAIDSLSLDYAMTGIDAYAVRDGWAPGSLFAGMIGGENPSGGSHSQIDSGAFVYHNHGVMWFTDMGSDNYNLATNAAGHGYFSNYGLYRRNAEGNNSLCLKALPYGQKLSGRGVMREHSSSGNASYCIIDNASVYGDELVFEARRGMLLTNSRKTLIIKDELTFTKAQTAFWVGHYESDKITAELSDDGKSCIMTHKDGEKLSVHLVCDGAKFEIMDCYTFLLDGTETVEGEHSRENHRRLVVRLENVEKIDMSVVIGEYSGDAIPAMKDWKNI